MYVYLIGVFIYALIWIILFFLRKDLRKKLFLSSLFCAPLGISEILFIPEYWIPKFKVIHLGDELFLESLLFCFFLGGVVAVSYQIIFKEKLLKTEKINPILTLIAPIIFLLYFINPFKTNLMNYVLSSLFLSSLVTFIFLKKREIKIIFLSAILNTTFYAIFYFSLWYSFYELPASYQFQNLSGILIGGIPIEEFLWIFSFSLFWMPMYEIWRNYFKRKNEK